MTGVELHPAYYDRPYGPLSLLDARVGSLGCAGCGGCCEDLILGFDPRVSARRVEQPGHADALAAGNVGALDAQFFADGWWEVEWYDDHGSVDGAGRWLASCSAYDADTRRCTIHDKRPPICGNYPHYNVAPGRDNQHPDHPQRIHRVDGVASCSYYLDHPGWAANGARPLLPVTVV